MSFLDYALHHIGCAARLARGDERALADMDISADGFWLSFGAIPAAIPALFFSWVVEARQLQSMGVLGSVPGIAIKLAVLEILFWILPVIALALVVKPLGYSRRFSHLIVTRNWLSTLLSYLFVVLPLLNMLLGGGGPSDASALLWLIIMGVAIWLSIRVTRIALNSPVAVAVGFVAVETVILLPLSITVYGLVGLNPQV